MGDGAKMNSRKHCKKKKLKLKTSADFVWHGDLRLLGVLTQDKAVQGENVSWNGMVSYLGIGTQPSLDLLHMAFLNLPISQSSSTPTLQHAYGPSNPKIAAEPLHQARNH